MKTILFLFYLTVTFDFFSQITNIPDSNFEQALIDLGYDSGIIDGQVLSNNISSITNLDVSYKNISDLTGIEDFTTLQYLLCDNNQLTSLNVQSNIQLKNLICDFNQISTLDLSMNTVLEVLSCSNNQLTMLLCGPSNNLYSIDCSFNQLTALDVSFNWDLAGLSCFNNNLMCLNMNTNNNINITSFVVINNPNLTCIQVDDVTWANNNWSCCIDNGAYFSTNCPIACNVGLNETKNIENKKLNRIIDVFGREINPQKNTILIYEYNDGTTEKIIIID
jgi:hypothetical protein